MKFMIIKGYSHNIWLDIRQLLDQLVIAELSGRVPIVHWGSNSFYDGTIYNNAYNLYFEPITNYTIEDVMKPEYSFFPSTWNPENLLIPDPELTTLVDRNIGEIIESQADVVVCDSYSHKMPILNYIGEDHPLYGMEARHIYRYLIKKYLKLKPDISQKISKFYYTHHLNDGPSLAVHVRGEYALEDVFSRYRKISYYSQNKIKNTPVQNTNDTLLLHQIHRLHKINKEVTSNKVYHKEIQFLLGRYGIRKLFLMTDSAKVIDEYKQIYGSILEYSEAPRLLDEDKMAPYLETHMHRRRNGINALLDGYLASNCDFFLGDGHSDESHAVTYLKDWPNTNIKLMYWYPRDSVFFKYEQERTVVYPRNEFVGKTKQLKAGMARTWNRLKDQ